MSLLIQPARQEDFLSCREQVFERNFLQHGIGSLAEKSQHAILKNYYCPNPAEQEINLGPFVADIANREGVTEIQTKGFGKIWQNVTRSQKLRVFFGVQRDFL